MPTVTAHGVTKRFGPKVALSDVDIELAPGITGLLGPNGAGKTTLLRILATVLRPDDGQIQLLGHDPSSPEGRLAVRRQLGYLPQEPGFHRSFTAFEFVDYVAILKEWGDRRSRHDEVRRVLSLVGLEAVMGTPIKKLSGGMRRRVAIAQALLGAEVIMKEGLIHARFLRDLLHPRPCGAATQEHRPRCLEDALLRFAIPVFRAASLFNHIIKSFD